MSNQDERERAEARANKARVAARDAEKARAQHEADAQAVREKTAKLRALRLAKEAADAAAGIVPADAKPPKAAKSGGGGKSSAGKAAGGGKKGKAAEKSVALSDWLSDRSSSGRRN